MNKSCFGAFALGAILGGAAVWAIAKKKYEEIISEEIESVKQVYAQRSLSNENAIQPEEDLDRPEKPAMPVAKGDIAEEYSKLISKNQYDAPKENDMPYVIMPEEFGEFDDYECISLTYYADDILADEDDIIDNADEIVGENIASHFGEYEDDSVFVRNDRLKCDCEILRDERAFHDVY